MPPAFINFMSCSNVEALPGGVFSDDFRDGASGVSSDDFLSPAFRVFSGVEMLGCGGGDLFFQRKRGKVWGWRVDMEC